MHLPTPPIPRLGFTLIEMSIVLAIIAMITVSAISMGNSMIGSAQLASTRGKLDAIETALSAYRLAYNRLPCPNDPTLVEGSAGYGLETGAAGSCTDAGGATYTVPSGTHTAPVGTTVVEGTVPVKTLGLPDEFQFDGWGRKFSYAVWTPLTAKATSTSSPAGFINYGISPSCGAITVENAGHGYRSTAAAYALVSYGPDGHGGYLKGGSRYNAGVTNVDEVANAHYNNSGVDTGYTATYVEKEYSTYAGDNDTSHPFGHLVRFKERWQMQDAYDTYQPGGAFCIPGFRIDGATASEQLAKGDYGSTGHGIYTADINGDGIPDLIIAERHEQPTQHLRYLRPQRQQFSRPLSGLLAKWNQWLRDHFF